MATIAETFDRALEHHRAGRLPEAEVLYRQILHEQPSHADVLHLLGVIAHQKGRHDLAIAHISKAIELNAVVADFHNNLGAAYRASGKLEEAVTCYRRALALKPDYMDAHYNLGNALKILGRLEEAVACYRRALALQPDSVWALNNLGTALMSHDKLEEAVSCYRRALALQPDSAEAHYNLGTVLQSQGRGEESVAHFTLALSLKPDDAAAENQLMHQLQHLCEWNHLDKLFEHQTSVVRAGPRSLLPPFTFLSIPSSPAEQLACAGNWVVSKLSDAVALRGNMGFCFARAPKERLCLGYLSSDFREHAMTYLFAELFELHDRASFEVSAYSFGPDDGSPLRKRIVHACDRFVNIAAVSFVDAARKIYEDGVDILIDFQGYTGAARTEIVALRPAPIQVNYLGYPGTMGADFIDYIITDRFITPPDQEPFFSEKFVYMPDCYQINDRRRKIGEAIPSRAECGLPDSGFVFCCFNHNSKITTTIFDVWMRLLKQVPASALWLLEPNSRAAVNLRREADARGVNPARMVFAPMLPVESHLARIRVADLFLDTLPYNAHTTASEALWVGLPVLTCAGETFASRVAGSLLKAIGVPELITNSLEDYEAKALSLAQNPSELVGLRRRLTENRLTAPLFDSKRFTRHLERAYQMMWENYLRGESPNRIEVPTIF
jgi:predicted O-linked N-acetylglucosamine transferase (SPINDLY family)